MREITLDKQAETQSTDFIELAADLVTAYVSNNRVPVSELPSVIASVHAAFAGLTNEQPAEPVGPEKPTPAQIKKSIAPDTLISFEDGKPYKTLKRHLTVRGLTPDGYRAKYGLPADYPMTSAAYSAQRSQLAHSLGLGRLRKALPKAASLDEMFGKTSKSRGSKAKAVDAFETAPSTRGSKKAAETS